MPIAADIKKLYPPSWPKIREQVLERASRLVIKTNRYPITKDGLKKLHDAGSRIESVEVACCEWCGRPDRWAVEVLENGLWSADGYGFHWLPSDLDDQPPEPDGERGGFHPTKTVLTIAHLDQDPRGDDPARLRALCQRCHLLYDARPEQRALRARIYAELRGQQTLFGGAR
jgi:hypothetical protein